MTERNNSQIEDAQRAAAARAALRNNASKAIDQSFKPIMDIPENAPETKPGQPGFTYGGPGDKRLPLK